MTRICLLIVLIAVLGAMYAIVGCSSDNPTGPSCDPVIVTTPSGLQYLDVAGGYGPDSAQGDTVIVHYIFWLADGTEVDNSYERGMPFSLVLGDGRVIKGFDEGITGMRYRGERKLFMPPHLAYGEHGAGSIIPPNSWLMCSVEVLEIQVGH